MISALRQSPETDVGTWLGLRRSVLGLDIGSSSIKLVQMKEAKGRYVLQKFGMKSLYPEVIVDGTVMDASRVITAIRELVDEQELKLCHVATSISGHSVIIKKITLPPLSKEELPAQVVLAAEQYIPFDINEVNLDFHVLNPLEQGDDGRLQMSLILVAAKKDKINEITQLIRAAGLIPAILDVEAFAIENMYGINYETSPQELVALVNIGASVMNINILKGDSSIFTRDISIGGNRYTEAIQRELGVSCEEAERLKKGGSADTRSDVAHTPLLINVIQEVNSEVAAEIAKSIDYFRTTNPEGDLSRLALCGGGAKVVGLVQHLRDRMAMISVDVVDPFSQIDVADADVDLDLLAQVAPMAGVGVGLALRTLGDR